MSGSMPDVAKRSAGLLLYTVDHEHELRVLIVHPGGPLWSRRDIGAWSVPKGEYNDDEDAFAAACREFTEELGFQVPVDGAIDLGEIRQRGSKVVRAWAVASDFINLTEFVSNTFEIEWPRGSGRMAQFPEIDQARWTTIDDARTLLNPAQVEFVNRLTALLATS
jgi:predicted NUDIX family NTP pyrophosphohydrolase